MGDSSLDYLQTLVLPLVLALPLVLVILIGMGFSIFQYRKAPKVSIFSFVALGLFLLLRLISLVQPVLNIWLMDGSIKQDSFIYINSVVSGLVSLFGALALGVLITAVWLERK